MNVRIKAAHIAACSELGHLEFELARTEPEIQDAFQIIPSHSPVAMSFIHEYSKTPIGPAVVEAGNR